MWKRRTPRTPGDRLWNYVGQLHRGDDHDPEEELRSLLPTARLVSEALKGGGEGPEHRSEARLHAAIANSQKPARIPHRNWALPAFACTGWVAATLGFSLFAYQSGLHNGSEQARQSMASAATLPVASNAVAENISPSLTEKSPIVKVKRHHKKAAGTPKETYSVPPSTELPPAVKVNEINPPGDDQIASATPDGADTPEERAQESLMRVGNAQLNQGEYGKAAATFEQAANRHPEDESALDALHFSGNIAERALNDPKRAGELYRREMEWALQLIEKRESKKDAPTQSVKIRLARALTSVGLLEKNPRMIQRATEESQGASANPSDTANVSPD